MAAREEVEGTEVLVAGMADSGLPCYLFPDCLGKVRVMTISPIKGSLIVVHNWYDTKGHE